ncbi:S53 family serine peptidase [Acidipila sp. EB88]|uniref:S53 family serine peptidase n=1 Tax=Acidipila sp. EB88 TaxID=2305226 RepID=UPI000F5E915F|nr:S53 family serine peptidase [Acidipila sp. EB88]RRA48264.1 peptidase S53 [Acidipila sp. EB88]
MHKIRRRPHFLITSLLLSTPLLLPASSVAQQRRALPSKLAAPAAEPAVGNVPDSQLLPFGITLPLRNTAELQQLLRAQQDPKSPSYHRYLSRAEFAERFAPTQADYDRVTAFARSQGFTVVRTFSNRLLLNVRGTPTQINKAFAVTMQFHQRTAAAAKYYAPDAEPTADATLPILNVVGLSTRTLPQPMLAHANAVHANTTGSGDSGQFLGSDMRAAYAPGVSLDGAGQSVALVELGPYNISDVNAYFKAVNQPLNVPIYNILLDVDGVCSGCDDGEEVIDMEQAISMAPGLSGLLIYEAYGSGSDALTAFAQAASDDVAKQLSLSFGFGGTPSTEPGYEQVFMQLAAQGQNLFIASGDSGANVGDVGYPGNSPNVTDVGGTDLVTTGPGGAWQSESAWVGSGGGWSTQSPIPAYQAPVINSANQGSTAYRNIPDIAMEANTDNFYCANGSCQDGIGGTSLAAPRWAGFLALANEQAAGNPIGFVNPTFYQLGQGSSYTTIFHDIVTGNDFNTTSPDMFQAVPGYDLTTGWGTPDGQSMLNTLAPASLAAAPNFALSASPVTLQLVPGASATTTVTVSPTNGFTAPVDLSVQVISAPAGVTAELATTTLTGSAQTTLSISTTSATPGGNFVAAVTGTSNGITHTAYVQLALPDFTLTATPATLYVNQGASASAAVAVDAINGFSTPVSLALTSLPPFVTGGFSPATTTTSSTLTLKAGATAPATSGSLLHVSGTAGATTRVVPSLSVAVSAALGLCGLGTPVDLSKSYNLAAIRTDGTAFTDGGLDGGGYAFSSTLLTGSRVLNGVLFRLGAANVADAVYGAGQVVALPSGRFNALQLLATGIDGNQSAQAVTVTYTDGTTAQLTPSFSDWFTPSVNVDEGEAVAMPYRNTAAGVADPRQFNLYSYTLLLNNAKTVKSMTLPTNRAVVILAATLSDLPLGKEVNLAGKYNATGIYPDGATFPVDGGYDGGGTAYSANLLQDASPSGEEVAVGLAQFHLAGSSVPNVVYGAGQTIALPLGHYTSLKLLGSAVQGDQLDQPVVIQYSDGTVDSVNQSFSDWSALSGYANESLAISTAYRDNNDGTTDVQDFNLYLYTLPLNPLKLVTGITLPNNRNVVFTSMTLAVPSAVGLEPLLCPILAPILHPVTIQ